MGPRGRSASFFLAFALPPRCGLASGPKFRLRGAAGADGSKGRGGPPNDEGGRVFVTWTPSSLDVTGGAVNAYRVWRRIGLASAALESALAPR